MMQRLRGLLSASLLTFCLAPLGTLTASAAPSIAPNNPAAVSAYARVLRTFNRQMPVWQSSKLAKHVLQNAVHWRVDANILVALVSVESSWRTHARSYAGAIGLGQLMPRTARSLHVNPRDPYQNLQGSAHYLGGLLKKYRNSPHRYSLAFAAYNAGPRAVSQFGGVPPYYETQHYVVKVMTAWKRVSRAVHVLPERAVAKVQVINGSPDVSYWSASR
jgi:soluble lytic murein transglycosylase-like protein